MDDSLETDEIEAVSTDALRSEAMTGNGGKSVGI
jgi:hypothetical protein